MEVFENYPFIRVFASMQDTGKHLNRKSPLNPDLEFGSFVHLKPEWNILFVRWIVECSLAR